MLNCRYKIVLVFILLTRISYSQNLVIGLSGGINFSKAITDEYKSKKQICPTIKLTSDFLLNEKFYLQFGLGYIQHCYSIDIFPNIKMSFNYIDISLAAKYKYKNFFVAGGPIFNIYINGATHINNYSVDFEKDFSENFLYGLLGEIGFELPLGRNFNLLLQSGYSIGFKDATKSDDTVVKFNGTIFLTGLNYNF